MVKFENIHSLKVSGQINAPLLYIETYGCQMNMSDSEVVASVLKNEGYIITDKIEEADVILVNTCSIRENAEIRVRGRLGVFKHYKRKKPGLIVGVIGCMAERIQENLFKEEKIIDIVAGPDSYRDLPQLLAHAETGQKAVNVILSREETYENINPVRLDENKITTFVSITRGCNNHCSYCVVPYTRGHERSRNPHTIISEINDAIAQGYKEVTLLGQNVDSYLWKIDGEPQIGFAQLLEMTALISPTLRVRFSTSHPKDINEEVLKVIAKHQNICRSIHLPVQSGNTEVLKRMKRRYSREDYMEKINMIHRIIPDCAISTDIIAGFCGETDDAHKDTLSLMEWAKYDFAYMFKYSERPGTFAAKNLADDIPEEVKSERLSEIIELQARLSKESNIRDMGKVFEVLVEGFSKKSKNELFGRTSQNKVLIFPKGNHQPGDYVQVEVTGYTSATLKGKIV